MKFSLFFGSLAAIFYIVSASQQQATDEHHYLIKRDHGLPYDTLPSTSCAVPSTCSNISGNVTCRCSDTITTCINTSGQYCWGSISLNSTSCPTMPTTCTSTLTGTTTNCLCNGASVLCVDNANNYCYGSVSGNSVSVLPLPYANATTSAAVSPAGTTATNSGMSVLGAPSNAATASPAAPTSGSDKLTCHTLLTLGMALVAYFVIH
ncbi:MAG: hypothetical protein EXX96DRAFT_558556 [Benjaminiella poitrasii]|nr:MAG: hypothetical protein EXX96DRAFT_558556 [Benjaminiella poitrasii]